MNQMALSSAPSVSIDVDAFEAEHILWLDSEGKEGKRANLRGLDLSRADLSGRRFTEASLRGAILAGANLRGADLRAADLSEANLTDANMSDAQLHGASLIRADLARANAVGADLSAANFTGANAQQIQLSRAKLQGAVLREANFARANFSAAAMREANLRSAICSDADLSGVDLQSSDCRDAVFDRAQFRDAKLSEANFRGAQLSDVDLQATDFTVAQEVAAEALAKSAQTERNNLQEEHLALDKTRAALKLEEERLLRFAGALEVYRTGQLHEASRLAAHSRWLSVCAFLWLMVSGGIAGFTVYIAMQLQHVEPMRMASILGIFAVAFLLALLSMLRSFAARRAARSLLSASVPAAENPAPS